MEFDIVDDLEFFEDLDTPIEPVDPIEPVEPAEPVDPDEGGEPADPADPVDPAEPVEPIGDDDAGIFTSAFELFKEKGLLNLPDDYQFEATEEGFSKALEATAERLRDEVMEALKEDLPAEGLALIKYMKSGGKDISKFVTVYSEPDYSQMELESDEAKKGLLKVYYQKTTKWPEAKIEKHLATLEVSGELEEEATTAKTEMAALQADERKRLEDQAAADAKARKDNEQKAIDSLSDVITKKSDINGYPISKADIGTVIPFLMKPVKIGDKITTMYNQKHAEIMRDPEKAVLLAKLVQSGLDLSVITKKQATQVTKTVKDKLKTALNFKGAVDTGGNDSDWDDIDNAI